MSMGASLAEARELYAILEDIEKKLAEINNKIGRSTTAQAALELTNFRINMMEIYTLTTRTLTLIRRISPDENFDAVVMRIQRLIMVLNSLRITMLALEAASGPVGWAIAGLGLLSSGLTIMEEINSEFERMARR